MLTWRALQALAQQPLLLPYTPLLHVLPDISGGDLVLKDVRAACLQSVSGSIRSLMVEAAASAERMLQSTQDADGALTRPACMRAAQARRESPAARATPSHA